MADADADAYPTTLLGCETSATLWPALPRLQCFAGPCCVCWGPSGCLLLQVFHANGVDLNTGDYEQRTALHVAASRGRPEVGFYLLNLPGIDVNVVDRSASAIQAQTQWAARFSAKSQHMPAVQQGHHAAVCMKHGVCLQGCLLTSAVLKWCVDAALHVRLIAAHCLAARWGHCHPRCGA